MLYVCGTRNAYIGACIRLTTCSANVCCTSCKGQLGNKYSFSHINFRYVAYKLFCIENSTLVSKFAVGTQINFLWTRNVTSRSRHTWTNTHKYRLENIKVHYELPAEVAGAGCIKQSVNNYACWICPATGQLPPMGSCPNTWLKSIILSQLIGELGMKFDALLSEACLREAEHVPIVEIW